MVAPQETAPAEAPSPKKRPSRWSALYFQVLIGIAAGVLVGWLFPSQAVALKPLSDGFIKILRLLLSPIIFVTVTLGLGSISDLRKVGRLGWKSLLYFEVVSTMALIIGLAVVQVVKPGAGFNADPRAFDAQAVSAYASSAKHLNLRDYLLGIIPAGAATPFVENDMLEVLFIAVLSGLALGRLGPKADVLHRGLEQLSRLLFVAVGYVMRLAPLAAFAAMAFTIGQYGGKSLVSLMWLILCFYITSAVFVFGILGAICARCGINIFKLLRFIKDELLLVLGTSTSEPALPLLMTKLERLGCSKSMVGFVLPAGYTFNLDGSSIYLTIAFIFLAQATNAPIGLAGKLGVLAVMLLTSKGSAGVPGAGFIALAATLSFIHSVPLGAMTLILGVDRFMSEMRSLVNVIGNTVATIVVSCWEGDFDLARARLVLDQGSLPPE